MNNTDKKYFYILISTLFLWLGALYLLYTYYYSPKIASHENYIQQVAQLDREVHALKVQVADVQTMQSLMHKKNNFLQQQLPSTMEFSHFLQQVNEYALTTGVNLQEIRPLAKEIQGDLQTQTLEIEIQGPFLANLNFLSKLHTAPRLIALDSGQMQADNGIIKTTVTVKIFAGK